MEDWVMYCPRYTKTSKDCQFGTTFARGSTKHCTLEFGYLRAQFFGDILCVSTIFFAVIFLVIFERSAPGHKAEWYALTDERNIGKLEGPSSGSGRASRERK
jgi:hypothetical protein